MATTAWHVGHSTGVYFTSFAMSQFSGGGVVGLSGGEVHTGPLLGLPGRGRPRDGSNGSLVPGRNGRMDGRTGGRGGAMVMADTYRARARGAADSLRESPVRPMHL